MNGSCSTESDSDPDPDRPRPPSLTAPSQSSTQTRTMLDKHIRTAPVNRYSSVCHPLSSHSLAFLPRTEEQLLFGKFNTYMFGCFCLFTYSQRKLIL